MNESCGNCSAMEMELEEARDVIENVEYELEGMQNDFWDEQSKAELYGDEAFRMMALLKKIGEEAPHMYMFLEAGTFKEFKDTIERGIE